MKLSEAIRLGAMLKPQARFVTNRDGRSCAMGAALEAIGKHACQYSTVLLIWPVTRSMVQQPVTGKRVPAVSAIRELNDFHCWTREQIAEWVESIELEQEHQQVEQQEVAVAK